jgi:23S rRNA pseudouridine1911/1915/1917 synthase
LTAKTWTVQPEDARIRLDKLLAGLMPDESRSRIQSWIRSGGLRVNSALVKAGYAVRPGDIITLEMPETAPDLPMPEDIPLPILYQDADLAVVDKPAGLVCHAGAGICSGTLVNALLFQMGPLGGGDPHRPGIVHRLDKQTSGILVVAKTPQAHRSLSQQFKAREVSKEYLALVHGQPMPPSGIIDWPLGRSARDRKKMSVSSRKTRTAVTRYEVIECYGPVSLLRVRPETGRTHQIRVHLAQKGHPVVGDTLYGGNRDRALPHPLRGLAESLRRHFLHAHRLDFHHPTTGDRLSFVSPLPHALRELLDALHSEAQTTTDRLNPPH